MLLKDSNLNQPVDKNISQPSSSTMRTLLPFVCIVTSQSTVDDCPVHVSPCAQGPCLTTPCLYVLHPVNWHLRITYPSFCASWLPDGFVQWKTLSRAQGQEREDRQVCSNHSFRLGLWQRLWLLRGACACQAASPLRVQFPRASQALCPTVLGFP